MSRSFFAISPSAMSGPRLTISVTAALSPAMPGVFSVPDRRPFSCPPPICRGFSFTPFLTTSAPTPLGPWILWDDRVYRSAQRMSKGTRR